MVKIKNISCEVPPPTVDGSFEIRRGDHQLRLVVKIPLFTTGSSTIQTVVTFAVFHPSPFIGLK